MKIIFGSFLSLCVGLVVVFAGTLAAQQAGPPAAGAIGAFVLAVDDEESAAKGPETKPHEPDVTRHGGKVIGSRGKYRFIELPIAAARALCAERGVAFMQRVWMGEPFESRGEAPCARPKAAAAVATTGVEDDLIWETGTYLYDGSGNIRKIGTDTYSYDSAGRLISATVGGKTENYRYDSFGNLVEKSIVGQTPGPIAVDSSSNRLLGVTYDVVGNVVTRGLNVHTYDSVGMQDSVQEPMNTVRFLYTADEERIVTWRNETEARITVRDFGGKVLRELSAGGNLNGIDTWVWEQDYVYGGGQLLGADREVSYGGRRHFHLDHLGSVRMITDESGLRLGRHDYYPFGVERTSPVQEVTNFGYDRPIAMKYTSHERDFRWLNADHTDYLDYMHARYYDPGLGRFLSVDPVLDVEKATAQPQRWNRYSYVENNPINRFDPDGRQSAGFVAYSIAKSDQAAYERGEIGHEELEQRSEARLAGAVATVGGLFGGGALRSAGLLLMRNPGTVLAAMKVLDSLGGNTARHINTTGLTGGKHNYLLNNPSKTGLFRGELGFTEKTIGAALRSHFTENIKNATIQAKSGNLEVTGKMVGANGAVWNMHTYWKWAEKTKTWEFVTSQPVK